MSEQKIESKYIDKDPPLGDSPQLEKKNNDYLAYLKEKLNFILGTYGRRLTSANGEINELVRTAEETTSRLSNAEGDISAISQRADNIEISVAGKVGENEVIAKINASPEQITISGNRINLVGQVTFSDLDSSTQSTINGKTTSSQVTQIIGNTVNAAYINALEITAKKIVATYTKTFSHNSYSNSDLTTIQNLITNRSWTASDLDRYDINMDGELTMSDLIKVRNMILNGTDETATIKTEIDPSKVNNPLAIYANGATTPTTYMNGTQVVGKAGNFTHLRTAYVDGAAGGRTFQLDPIGGLNFYDSNGDATASYPISNPGMVIETGEIIKSEAIREVDCSTSVNTNTKWFYSKRGNGDYECWTTIKYGASDLGQFTAGTVNNPETWAFADGGGKLYLRTLPALQYPVTFDEAPHETVSVSGCSSSDASWYGSSFWIIPFGAGTGNTTTRTGKYHCVRPSNFSNGIVYTIYVMGKVTV